MTASNGRWNTFVGKLSKLGGKWGKYTADGAGEVLNAGRSAFSRVSQKRIDELLGGGEILIYELSSPMDGRPAPIIKAASREKRKAAKAAKAAKGGSTIYGSALSAEGEEPQYEEALVRRWKYAMAPSAIWLLLSFLFLIVVPTATGLPLVLATAILAVLHAVVLYRRKWLDLAKKRGRTWVVSGLELVVPFLLAAWPGPGAVAILLTFYLPFVAALIVLNWQVDVEMIATDGRLIHGRGLWTFKYELSTEVGSVATASVNNLTNGHGSINIECDDSSKDDFLGFGIMWNPQGWSNVIMYYKNVFLTARFSQGPRVDLTNDPFTHSASELAEPTSPDTNE